MELLFESRVSIRNVEGRLRPIQNRPKLTRDPVLVGDSMVDGTGTTLHGSVLRDHLGGFRMYYQAWPWDWNGNDSALVGLALSEDGRRWQKPTLELQAYGDDDDALNNLVDLGFHSPSIWLDPEAPITHRYRATGFAGPHLVGANDGAQRSGYYAAHSDDGLHWTLDSREPLWPESAVITSMYHPTYRRGLAAMKRLVYVHGVRRRSLWMATCRDGRWSEGACALVPDEYDDVCAQTRGFVSGDYYGMGMMPAGTGTVGFLWNFRHSMPRSAGTEMGIYGVTDVSLVYQDGLESRWQHMPGRPDFISHRHMNWGSGGVYTASSPLETESEHWLFFSAMSRSHAWYLDRAYSVVEKRKAEIITAGLGRIGVARWPKWRLFGYRADPEGVLTINLGPVGRPSELFLNYETEDGGSIRVEIPALRGYVLETARPLTGKSLSEAVGWMHGTDITPADNPIIARIHLDSATIWAYELKPIDDEDDEPIRVERAAESRPEEQDGNIEEEEDVLVGFSGEIRRLGAK